MFLPAERDVGRRGIIVRLANGGEWQRALSRLTKPERRAAIGGRSACESSAWSMSRCSPDERACGGRFLAAASATEGQPRFSFGLGSPHWTGGGRGRNAKGHGPLYSGHRGRIVDLVAHLAIGAEHWAWVIDFW